MINWEAELDKFCRVNGLMFSVPVDKLKPFLRDNIIKDFIRAVKESQTKVAVSEVKVKELLQIIDEQADEKAQLMVENKRLHAALVQMKITGGGKAAEV